LDTNRDAVVERVDASKIAMSFPPSSLATAWNNAPGPAKSKYGMRISSPGPVVKVLVEQVLSCVGDSNQSPDAVLGAVFRIAVFEIIASELI
jgi:hypothetical protein